MKMNTILKEHNIPDGMLNSVTYSNSNAVIKAWGGERIPEENGRKIDNLVFVGSSRNKANIQRLCEQAKIYNPILEFEGTDIVYVHGDLSPDELDKVSKIITFGKLATGGQYCLSIEQVIIDKQMPENLKRYFINKLKEQFGKFQPGNIRENDQFTLSPASSPNQVKKLFRELNPNGEVLCGGTLLDINGEISPNGAFVAPSIIKMPINKAPNKELYSSILIILESDGNLESVIEYINGRLFRLRTSIHARDNTVIEYLISKLQSGTIIVNGNHLNFRFGIAGGTGLTTLDGQVRDWALDTLRRRNIVYGGAIQNSVKDVLKRTLK